MKSQLLLAAVALLALSACSTTPECADDRGYLNAQTVPPIVGGNGITVPQSPAALRIPPAKEGETASVAPTNTNRRTACLDFPPEIAGSAAK